ncbi:MAG: isoaspartyl peptidase/L-asparaginase [Sphingomonadaceae bacterium]|nr:isoaspartyl peptidase/L-asparaginase [Sphingomonadaceae bacterium]
MSTRHSPFALALHGGAGVKIGENYAPVEAHLDALANAGEDMLKSGGSSVDVVETMVREMEVSGLYVAGKGSAPNLSGEVELDASIMDGATQKAGAVAIISNVVSPVAVARGVMERSSSVMLAGRGANEFAASEGFESIADPDSYFVLPVGVSQDDISVRDMQHGTVGAVALDMHGNLAAATSTGGIFGKPAGRVGDTPIIGVGTWADRDVAISCTGTGEHFICAGGALTAANRFKLSGDSLEQALWKMLDDVKGLGGDGGAIAVSRTGEIAMLYNSDGMKRAAVSNTLSAMSAVFAPCK